MTSNHSHASGLDLHVVTEVPLRQFTWWLLMVLLVTLFGYPGVVCITPMAWLLALRVGNLVAWHSKSGLRSQRLTESVLAGGLLGLLQGMLFGIIVPFMGPGLDDEWKRSIVLILVMLVVGTIAGAGLSLLTAFLNEIKRGSS